MRSISRIVIVYLALWLLLVIGIATFAMNQMSRSLALKTPWTKFDPAPEKLIELWDLGGELIGKSETGKYFVCNFGARSCATIYYWPDPYYGPNLDYVESFLRGTKCDYARINESTEEKPANIVSCSFRMYGDQMASGEGMTTMLDVNGNVWTWEHMPLETARQNALDCVFAPLVIIGSIFIIPFSLVIATRLKKH